MLMTSQLHLLDTTQSPGPQRPWEPGRFVIGPEAWRIASTELAHLLPEMSLDRFPVWQPPPPPLLNEELSEEDQLRYLIAAYNGLRSKIAGRKQMIFGGRIPTTRARIVLQTAAAFFRGEDRKELSEFYEDGRRKMPEKISPVAWLAWSFDLWSKTKPGTGSVGKEAVRTTGMKFPSIVWAYASHRFRNQKTINWFTHSWQHFFVMPPVPIQASQYAVRCFEHMRRQIEDKGFSSTAGLLALVKQDKELMVGLAEEAAREKRKMDKAAQELLKLGQWVWA